MNLPVWPELHYGNIDPNSDLTGNVWAKKSHMGTTSNCSGDVLGRLGVISVGYSGHGLKLMISGGNLCCCG